MVLAVSFPLWHSGPVNKSDYISHNGRNDSAILAQLEYTVKNGLAGRKTKGAVPVSYSCTCNYTQNGVSAGDPNPPQRSGGKSKSPRKGVEEDDCTAG